MVVLHIVPEEFDKHQASLRETDEFQNYSLRQEEGSAARFARKMAEATLDESRWKMIPIEKRVGDPVEQILAVGRNSMRATCSRVAGAGHLPGRPSSGAQPHWSC